jgi:hypothetical protein
VTGVTILWIIAFVIGVSLLVERPRVETAATADSAWGAL